MLNNHRYMLRAIKTDATIPQAVKDAEAAKHQRACQIMRSCVPRTSRSAPSVPFRLLLRKPIEDGGADV